MCCLANIQVILKSFPSFCQTKAQNQPKTIKAYPQKLNISTTNDVGIQKQHNPVYQSGANSSPKTLFITAGTKVFVESSNKK